MYLRSVTPESSHHFDTKTPVALLICGHKGALAAPLQDPFVPPTGVHLSDSSFQLHRFLGSLAFPNFLGNFLDCLPESFNINPCVPESFRIIGFLNPRLPLVIGALVRVSRDDYLWFRLRLNVRERVDPRLAFFGGYWLHLDVGSNPHR